MRKAFIKALCEAASSDKKIMLLTGDLGYRFLEPFAQSFPDQFLNIGVAESNLVNVAAGLASVGYKPFIYSIATFASMRAFEQIRTVVALQKLPVIIVGIGAGLAYAKAGATHHSMEDIGLMRLIPNMTIIAPADTFECYSATKVLTQYKSFGYLRLERNPDNNWYDAVLPFVIGKAHLLVKGKKTKEKKIAIFTTGTKFQLGMRTAALLARINCYPSVVSFPTIYPLDTVMIQKIIQDHPIIVTIEEHKTEGGFGSAIGEEILLQEGKVTVLKFGFQKGYSAISADYETLMNYYQLTPETIAQAIQKYVQNHH